MNGENQEPESHEVHSSTVRAQDSTKEFLKVLISLASGVLALSVTFLSNFFDGSGIALYILFAGWVLLALCIYFGITALTVLTRCIMNETDEWWKLTLRPARSCWVCFQGGMVGLILFAGVVFALKNLINETSGSKQSISITADSVHLDYLKSKEEAGLSNDSEQLKNQTAEQAGADNPLPADTSREKQVPPQPVVVDP